MTGKRPILLVTGASRGIGAAVARLAGARGYDVAINYLRDEAGARTVANAITGGGGKAILVQADVSREDEVTRMFDAVRRELGTPTHLVCNSGITGPASRLEAVTAETMQQVFATNVLGTLYCARAAIPLMSTRRGGQGGCIILLSSAAATLGTPNEFVWYAASKGAIDTLNIGLSREVAEDGIRVNAVAPGLIDTEMNSAERQNRLRGMVPLGRVGHADEVAEGILYLMSDSASYVTGALLRISGGR